MLKAVQTGMPKCFEEDWDKESDPRLLALESHSRGCQALPILGRHACPYKIRLGLKWLFKKHASCKCGAHYTLN